MLTWLSIWSLLRPQQYYTILWYYYQTWLDLTWQCAIWTKTDSVCLFRSQPPLHNPSHLLIQGHIIPEHLPVTLRYSSTRIRRHALRQTAQLFQSGLWLCCKMRWKGNEAGHKQVIFLCLVYLKQSNQATDRQHNKTQHNTTQGWSICK